MPADGCIGARGDGEEVAGADFDDHGKEQLWRDMPDRSAVTKDLAKLPKMTGECGEVGTQLIRGEDGNAIRCQTPLQLMDDDLGILQASTTDMPNGNDLGESIEGDPDAMSAGIAFDVTKEFIKLQVSEIKILEVGIMNTHGLGCSTFKPQSY